MATATMAQLRDQVRGEIFTPEDAAYDEARRVYNAMIDRRPRVIVRCAGVDDVMAAVNFAREEGLDLAVRGGGAQRAGLRHRRRRRSSSTCRHAGSRGRPARQTARAEGGATWGDFNDATHAFGLATTGGIISTTGVGGLTLGGGIGYLARGLGLSCDNLISADVVTADGRLLIRERERERGPVLGAARRRRQLRRRRPRSSSACTRCSDIYGGPIFFELERRRRRAALLPRVHRATRPSSSAGSRRSRSRRRCRSSPRTGTARRSSIVVTCWAGPIDEGEAALKPLREVAPVVAEHVGPMPYPALNSAFDALVPPGLQHYWKANFVTELTDDAIAAHVEHGPRVPAVNSTVHIYPINGACHRVAPTRPPSPTATRTSPP